MVWLVSPEITLEPPSSFMDHDKKTIPLRISITELKICEYKRTNWEGLITTLVGLWIKMGHPSHRTKVFGE